MRTILILMINLFVCVSSFAQVKQLQLPMSDGQVEFKEVVEVPGSTQKDLFRNAKLFFVNNFKSAKNVIDIEDQEDGLIVGKGNFLINFTYAIHPREERINFVIKINCKDDKYRYIINSFSNENHTINTLNDIVSGTKKRTMYTSKNYAQKMINEINNDVVNTIRALKAQMKTSTVEDDF